MALSQWGIWDDDLDPQVLALMAQAYIGRKRFEARLLVAELARALATGKGGRGAHKEISPDQFLGMFGQKP